MTLSLDSYRELMRTALAAGLSPAAFGASSTAERTLWLRHDVDYSLDMAVKLAHVNSELGLSATFFILLRGHAYNALSKTSLDRLSELISLGQRLGLHIPGSNEADLASDFEYLARQVPLQPIFSWHNPTPEVLAKYRDREVIEGLTNVYSKRFLDDALYCSDSNFDRTYEEMAEAVGGKRGTVHLLLHPINWVAGGASMIEVFEHAWPYLIRECELEARTNRVYAGKLPEGMPESLLTEFSRRWREAAG